MGEAMKGATKAMRAMNRQMNLPGIQRIAMDFERESEMMDMKEEIMNDVMDDVMETEGDEADSDEIVNQVLDEIGISVDQLHVQGTLPKVAEKKLGGLELSG